MPAVVEALRGTGYEISFRAVANTRDCDSTAGKAVGKGGREVEFSVTVLRDGSTFSEKACSQPPVLRFEETDGTNVGNIHYQVVPQAPLVRRKIENVGVAAAPNLKEREMEIRIAHALDDLFADEYVPEG